MYFFRRAHSLYSTKVEKPLSPLYDDAHQCVIPETSDLDAIKANIEHSLG